MPRFTTVLVPGDKPPYERWIFLDIPEAIAVTLGRCPCVVAGTVNLHPFRSTMHHSSGGTYRVVVRKGDLPPAAHVGDLVEVVLDADKVPHPVEIPAELTAIFEQYPDLSKLFERMAPSHRRAWVEYVASAKQPATRVARAAKAPDGIRNRAFPR